jgi:hypothetical protein
MTSSGRLSLPAVVLLLAAAVAPTPGHAETSVCTVIPSLPFTITTPGTYCMNRSMGAHLTGAPYDAIRIQETHDVVLDCNGHPLIGSQVAATENWETYWDYVGIHVGSSARVTIRNCFIIGFYRAIAVERGGDGLPRSVDVTVEDNRIKWSNLGLLFISEGEGVVRRNHILQSKHTALSLFVPPTAQTRTTVEDNDFIETGNTVAKIDSVQIGPPLQLESGGGSAWLAFRDNRINGSKAQNAGGQVSVVKVLYGSQNIEIEGNRILAPLDSSRGTATTPIGGAGSFCHDNVIVGYGAGPFVDCADASNAVH